MSTFKKLLPYLVALLVFLGISLIYFSPAIEGKTLQQSDIIHYKGTAKEIADYRDKTGDEALWTNSQFGGMPAFQISTLHPGNLMPYLYKLFYFYILPHPISILMLLLIGFFILLLSLKVDPWLGIVGALAFAFSTYFFLFIEVGHNAKAIAIAFMPTVLGAMILTYRGKYLLGGALLAMFMAFEISVNHIQMTYYLLFIMLFYGITEFVVAIIKKEYLHFVKATGITLVAMLLAVGPSISNLWTSSEYMKETIRGGSELTNDKGNKTSGLDKDYITQWSYGVGETFTLLIPDAKGGASEPIGAKSGALDNVDRQMRKAIGQQGSYWGDLQFTSGPVYVGAIICFLFILGLFIVKKPVKWALFATTVFAIMMAWGHNMAWLTDFFINYIPYYNKFRAVSSWMIVVDLTMPLLAILAIKEIVDNPEVFRKKSLYFWLSFGLTAGISLIFWLTPTTFFDFISNAEFTQFDAYRKQGADANQINAYIDNLEIARISIFKASAIRSFLFILLGAGLLFLYSRMKKMSKYVVYGGLGLLILIDLWVVDKHYLNKEDFVAARQMEVPYPKTTASDYILKDLDPDYRVLNLATGNFTMDASVSYYHKSIGGYHAAKLRRYQDLIEHRLFNEVTSLTSVLNKEIPDSVRIATMYSLSSLNMLNTRYYIYNPEAPPLRNPAALGNAWFVKKVKVVDNADEEIKALNNFNPSNTVIVDKRFESMLGDFKEARDPESKIVLREYAPNKLTYDAIGLKENQLAVFSEIYYPHGWKVTIDGQEAPYFRANYVLRAMVIPKGNHTIVFSFEPRSYILGTRLSYAGSIILILLVLAAFGWELRNQLRKRKNALPEKK
jgi:hypothetical protein